MRPPRCYYAAPHWSRGLESHQRRAAFHTAALLLSYLGIWRKGWDSNPRALWTARLATGCLKPLGHLSVWRRRWDSNPRSSARQAGAFAAMLLRRFLAQGAGLEPTHTRLIPTLSGLYRLSYPGAWCPGGNRGVVPPAGLEPARIGLKGLSSAAELRRQMVRLGPPAGVEPATTWFEARCSVL